MRKYIFILFLVVFLPVVLFSQNKSRDRVVLKNGDVYVGEITLKTETLLMIKTVDGNRFQFPLTDIKSIEQDETTETAQEKTGIDIDDETDFGLLLGIRSNGFFKGLALPQFTPAIEGELVLGMRNIANQNVFLGVGVGYEIVSVESDNVHILPIFGRVQKNFSKRKVAPYVSFDLGYSIIQNEDWNGGVYSNIGGGVSFHVGTTSRLLIGLNLGLQGCETYLTETSDGKNYSFYKNTIMPKIGINVSILL